MLVQYIFLIQLVEFYFGILQKNNFVLWIYTTKELLEVVFFENSGYYLQGIY